MCTAVYIVSDRPLPTVARAEESQPFSVQDATEGFFYPRNPLEAHFGRKHFYSASCHLGCGCGFAPGEWRWDEETGEESIDPPPSKNPESRRGLAEYLSAALGHQPAVEVFICVSGDESYPPHHRRRASPADFTRDFTLYETMGQVVVVSDDGAEADAGPDLVPESS